MPSQWGYDDFHIVLVVLHGCEAWPLILREKHRLKTLENGAEDEVTGGWRKLHNDELHNLHSSPSIIES
jgi:hypothetical protein